MLEQWQCSQHRMWTVRRRIYAAHITPCRGILEQLEQVEIDAFPTAFVTDHHIPLTEGAVLPKGPIYRLSPLEDDALAKYVQENLEKGFITRSESPAASPVLFVKNKDGSLRMCVDYRKLNELTVNYQEPIPTTSHRRAPRQTGKGKTLYQDGSTRRV
jgi:hypothetical protein